MSKNHKTTLKRARRKRYIKRKKQELTSKLKLMQATKPRTEVKAPAEASSPDTATPETA